MSYYFVIIGPKDTPLYEATLGNPLKDENKHLYQFIVHAALDFVDDALFTTNNMFLRVVDKYNDWLVSAHVTAGNIRFMLLHDVKNEDGVRNFFAEAYELYIKILLNPFYEVNNKIDHPNFDMKIRGLAKKHL
ncbi:hypothetical protein HMI54_015285 [Coelomomyces lativittatus]|nr:hypothetical protein HMI55_001084 [Coelomomyces lativittatus]KAJ1513018.1 hypothetical protein HMI54_015285 [Coelomomyces lativittatus]